MINQFNMRQSGVHSHMEDSLIEFFHFNIHYSIIAIFISLIGYLACTLLLVMRKFKEKWFIQFMIIASALWLIFPPAFVFSLINTTFIFRNWNRLKETQHTITT